MGPHQYNKIRQKIRLKPKQSHSKSQKLRPLHNQNHQGWSLLHKHIKRVSTKGTNWMVWDTLMEHFITEKAASMLGSGNKTRWMVKALCTTPTMKLHTKATGKTISFTGTELCTTNKWQNYKNLSTTKTGPWSNSIGSSTKGSSAWITSTVRENYFYPMVKCLKEISRRTWSMGRAFWAGITAPGSEVFGGRTSFSECTEFNTNAEFVILYFCILLNLESTENLAKIRIKWYLHRH